MSTETEDRPDEPPRFEAALEELEEIVQRLDREELDLDEALRLFEDGVARLRTASELLSEARGRVEELIEEASGELSVVEVDLGSPGDEEEGSEEA